MKALLFSLMILFQGIPFPQGGTVTGVLRDSKGVPVAGVRMAAVARGDGLDATGSSMAGIAVTDAQGKFTLENIPSGRYVIAAGRLDLQTYYPGTQTFADATVVTIASGSTISGISFVLGDSSAGRADSMAGMWASRIVFAGLPAPSTPSSAVIAFAISVENGGKVPVTANGREISVRLRSATDDLSIPIDSIYVEVPSSRDFSVSVEGLPETYKLKSVTFGGTDITNGTFRVSAPPGTVSWTLRSASSNAGATAVNIINMPPSSAPLATISITLSIVKRTTVNGVSVWGHVGLVDRPALFISGVPGTLYKDGSFEFRNVPPGRHLIAAIHKFTPQATVVVVGDKDIFGLGLQRTLAPADVMVPAAIPPAGPQPPGTVIPLPRILGTVVDAATGMPPPQGLVTVENENYRRTFELDAKGRFESFALFPGDYDITLWVLNHIRGKLKVAVDDKDVPVALPVDPEQ